MTIRRFDRRTQNYLAHRQRQLAALTIADSRNAPRGIDAASLCAPMSQGSTGRIGRDPTLALPSALPVSAGYIVGSDYVTAYWEDFDYGPSADYVDEFGNDYGYDCNAYEGDGSTYGWPDD